MIKRNGFTLIELLMFIVVISILASTIMISSRQALLQTPNINQGTIATELAAQCIEAYLGDRRLNGIPSIYLPAVGSCPGAMGTKPSLCANTARFTIAVNLACGPTISGDATYRTLTVTVTPIGVGQGTASNVLLIADY